MTDIIRRSAKSFNVLDKEGYDEYTVGMRVEDFEALGDIEQARLYELYQKVAINGSLSDFFIWLAEYAYEVQD